MAHRPTAPAVDTSQPLEFASERYFQKVLSLDESSAGPASATTSDLLDHDHAPTAVQTLPFIPGRRPSTATQKTSHDGGHVGDKGKRTFSHDFIRARPSLSVRSKFPVRSASSAVIAQTQDLSHTTSKTPSTFLENFSKLPQELQLQVIVTLPLSTILQLRLTSRFFAQLVALNEAPIARYHYHATIPAYARRLYPAPQPADMTLRHVYGIWHRLHVAWKLARLIAEQTTKEIFLRTNDAQRAEFDPQYKRMRQRLMPAIFTIFHFFETTRDLHARHLAQHGIPLHLMPYTVNPIERRVMEMYDDQTLLNVHQVFPLVMASFSRRLRPPSYIGRLERSIKGYLKDKPADEVYTTILAVGGMRQAERFWDTKGYNARRVAVDNWYGAVLKEPIEQTPKSKMSLISSFTRKKHAPPGESTTTDNMAAHDASTCVDWYCVKCAAPELRRRRSRVDASLSSSLSEGPPMGPLPREQLRLMLMDLPLLSNIWLPTGEALILERQIVDSPAQIRRNTQVLLDLIKEDGRMVEEWSPDLSYESVRRSSEGHVPGMDVYGM